MFEHIKTKKGHVLKWLKRLVCKTNNHRFESYHVLQKDCVTSLTGKTSLCGSEEQGSSPGYTQKISMWRNGLAHSPDT